MFLMWVSGRSGAVTSTQQTLSSRGSTKLRLTPVWLGPVSKFSALFSTYLGIVVPLFDVKLSYIFGIVNLICTVSNLILYKSFMATNVI